MGNTQPIEITGLKGTCGDQAVFLAFAPAALLYRLSFADVLDEATGKGYQRRFSDDHSLQFRKYIRSRGATTIPLTFNLRPENSADWEIRKVPDGGYLLWIRSEDARVLAQVDCQHRLGYLSDQGISLAFMTFIGLTVDEEMAVFNTINGKAKGLSSSLLDYHEAKLSRDLSSTRPELFIALRLNETPSSPWYQRLDLGGNRTVGMLRYASLRTMQKAVKRFLKESGALDDGTPEHVLAVVTDFWSAVTQVLSTEWKNPRRHLITKGIGVYSLMSLAGDLYRDARRLGVPCDRVYFVGALSDFVSAIDWSSDGPLRGFGGTAGADQALQLIRSVRRQHSLRMIPNA